MLFLQLYSFSNHYLVPDRERCLLNMLCSRSSPVTVLYGDGDTVPPPPEKFLDREGASLTDCKVKSLEELI